jgi:lipoyl(octanoyl) transferase
VAIGALGEHGVRARTIEGLTGVWTEGAAPGPGAGPDAARKIGSIGVHVSRAVTTHGLAINVNNDLQPFEWIVPCGIESCLMSSLARELGAAQDLDGFATAVSERFGEIYARTIVEASVDELAQRVPALPLLAEPAAALR